MLFLNSPEILKAVDVAIRDHNIVPIAINAAVHRNKLAGTRESFSLKMVDKGNISCAFRGQFSTYESIRDSSCALVL